MWRRRRLGKPMADTDPLVTAPPMATTVRSPVPRDPGRQPPPAVPSPPETRSSPTLDYLRGREHVLGHQRWLSRDPAQAAHDLVTDLGMIGARKWVQAVFMAIIR